MSLKNWSEATLFNDKAAHHLRGRRKVKQKKQEPESRQNKAAQTQKRCRTKAPAAEIDSHKTKNTKNKVKQSTSRATRTEIKARKYDLHEAKERKRGLFLGGDL